MVQKSMAGVKSSSAKIATMINVGSSVISLICLWKIR